MKSSTIKGTETEKNLMKAFAGETQSLARYRFYSKQAKKDGYPQIAEIFKATSKNKLEHARAFYSLLEGGNVEITSAFPAVQVADTASNLAQAAVAEHEKWSEIYPEFAKVAQDEGFTHIATIFHHVMAIDSIQDQMFTRLAEQARKKTIYISQDGDQRWRCHICGHIHHGATPPDTCPLCGNPKEFFKKDCGCGPDCECGK